MCFEFVLCCLYFTGVFGNEVKSVSVMEGDSVTLHTDVTEIKTDAEIMWKYGPRQILIAQAIGHVPSFKTFDGDNERFKDRLKLDYQTGDLTIRDVKTEHTGLYKLQIIRKNISYTKYNVTVYARLPVPVISRDSSQCSSSKCSVLCSVMNVTHVSLSWYNESRVHSSTSVSDLNIRLSLSLEVEYQDTNTYTCVINNSVRGQTQHLSPDVCQPCSDRVHCCGFTETVIRLVVSAVVGVATVAVLVYDIRSRRDEQKRLQTHPSNAVESHALTSVLESQESQ